MVVGASNAQAAGGALARNITGEDWGTTESGEKVSPFPSREPMG